MKNLEDLENWAMTKSSAVEEGDLNPLDAFLEFNYLVRLLDDYKKSFYDAAKEEAQLHEKEFNYRGCKISYREIKGRYSFKNIPEIERLNSELKLQQDYYKTLADGIEKGITKIIDGQMVGFSGELVNAPVRGKGSSSLVVGKQKPISYE